VGPPLRSENFRKVILSSLRFFSICCLQHQFSFLSNLAPIHVSSTMTRQHTSCDRGFLGSRPIKSATKQQLEGPRLSISPLFLNPIVIKKPHDNKTKKFDAKRIKKNKKKKSYYLRRMHSLASPGPKKKLKYK
jgi:hypothetical protein